VRHSRANASAANRFDAIATRAVTHAMAESSDHRPVFPGFRAGFAEIAGLECTG
jgi:hypothetical protein